MKKKWLRVSRVKQDSEMNDFCPKQGQSLRASAAIPHPNFRWVPQSHWAVREEHAIDNAVSARLSSKETIDRTRENCPYCINLSV